MDGEIPEKWLADYGYILSTDHSLHDDIPLENVKALIDTVLKYGDYKPNA